MLRNPQRRIAIVFWVLAVIFAIAIFAPAFFGVAFLNGGFAISAMALLGAAISLVVATIYRDRARSLDRIIGGEGLLAHWEYNPGESNGPLQAEKLRSAPQSRGGEAYIAAEGIFLNGQLHIFTGWGIRLDKALYDEEGKFLGFTYSFPTREGRSDYTVRVPVPPGKEDEARRVISSFQRAPGETQ